MLRRTAPQATVYVMVIHSSIIHSSKEAQAQEEKHLIREQEERERGVEHAVPVSYTHLTLPTKA